MRWYGAQSSRARWAASVPQNEPSTHPENRTQTGWTGASGENAPSKNFRSAAPLCVVPSGRTATGRPPLNSAACVARACRCRADGFGRPPGRLSSPFVAFEFHEQRAVGAHYQAYDWQPRERRHHHRARRSSRREEPLQQAVVRREDDDRRFCRITLRAPVVDSQRKHAEAPHREARQSDARRFDTRAHAT